MENTFLTKDELRSAITSLVKKEESVRYRRKKGVKENKNAFPTTKVLNLMIDKPELFTGGDNKNQDEKL